ncbi:ATP-binding protein [Modestobacter marinus]|uniref:ATP-binding protein n=1 Tax=Modestobacter marinus TaxID=477641 RepID=UPI001C948FCE|nr:ATP-binding protein [Modestobacter marinus]
MTALRGPSTRRPGLSTPYVGPRALGSDDRLYGRDRETRELFDLLIADRNVLLHAPSGAGKTSLIQAAVIPVLEDEGFRSSGPLRVNAVPPRGTEVPNRYLWSLLTGLWSGADWEPDLGPGTTLVQALDVLDTRTRTASLSGDGEPPQDHVLVIGQFEEVLILEPTVQRPYRAMEEVPAPHVEPVQLQLQCHRLWRVLEPHSGRKPEIHPADVRRALEHRAALADYHADAVREVAERTRTSERAIRDWAENELISSVTNFRTQTMTGPDTRKTSPEQVLRELEDRYLIHGENRGAATRYELSHDGLLELVRANNAAWRRAKVKSWEAAGESGSAAATTPATCCAAKRSGGPRAGSRRGVTAPPRSSSASSPSRRRCALGRKRGSEPTQVMVVLALIAGVLLLSLIVCIVLLTRRVGRRQP